MQRASQETNRAPLTVADQFKLTMPSHRLIAGGTDPTGWRLPAEALESTVRRLVAAHLREMAMRHGLLAAPDAVDAATLARRGSISPPRSKRTRPSLRP